MKTVIITGAGSGIGAAAARAVKTKGYNPVGIGLEQTADLPADIIFHQADITNEEKFAEIVANYSDIYAVINCAGVVLHQEEWTSDGFAKAVDINLNASMRCAMAALPSLEKSRGCVVNIASGAWSYFGSPRVPAYCASKTGVIGLTRSLAVAWAPKGIRVNAIAPGWIETRISHTALNDTERRQKILDRIPAGRFGRPTDIARAICFLLSEDAEYITGVTLPVDGGFSIA